MILQFLQPSGSFWSDNGCRGIEMTNKYSAWDVYPQGQMYTRTEDRSTLARTSSSVSQRISTNT
jgi:hypothetical protein